MTTKLRIRQTITAEIIAECSDLPPAARRELWRGRTLNRAAVAAIDAAIDAANLDDKPADKEPATEENEI